jgi:sec-independent protein translocase protein TatC
MTAVLRAPRRKDPNPDVNEGKMAFLDHLDEVRKRLIHSIIAIGMGMLVASAFIGRIVNFLVAPARKMLPAGSHLIFTQPGEAFSLYLTVALIAGAVLAAPYVMYQVWLFIASALYAKEKRFAVPFVFLTTVGSLVGAAFSHYLLFPSMMAFFGTFSSPDLVFMPRVEDTFDLYLRMLGGMVLVF